MLEAAIPDAIGGHESAMLKVARQGVMRHGALRGPQQAKHASLEKRRRLVRLLVKQVLVGPERIVIRHSIPVSGRDPPPRYRLRWGRHAAPPLRSPALYSSPLAVLPHADLEPLLDAARRAGPRSGAR